MRGQGRPHWIVTVDGGVATFSSLIHASNALKSIGIIASPSRLYSDVTVPITSADDGLKWRFRALYPEGAASRGACVSYMGTNHTS
jgi:hypothetical protein